MTFIYIDGTFAVQKTWHMTLHWSEGQWQHKKGSTKEWCPTLAGLTVAHTHTFKSRILLGKRRLWWRLKELCLHTHTHVVYTVTGMWALQTQQNTAMLGIGQQL